MATYKIKPGGMHQKFFQLRTKIQMLGGGFGNGKTAAACIKAIQLATDYPGSNGLIARETYPKLNDTIRKEFYKWIPAKHVERWPTKDDNTLILKNGSVINFRYIAQRGKQTVDGFTTSNLLSATYDWVVVDQIEDPQIQYKDFLDLLGRLRGSTPYKGNDPTMPITGPRWLILTCNPTANWVYQKLVKPYHRYLATGLVTEDLLVDKTTLEPIITILEAATMENAHNLDPDFIATMEAAYKGQMKERFLEGKWAAFEGLVYPTYSSDFHVLPHEKIMEILHKARRDKVKLTPVQGYDNGLVSPSCYLLGFTDYQGRVFFVDGFYKPTPNAGTAAAMILEIQERYRDYIDIDDGYIYADPAIFKRTVLDGQGENATTVAKILKSYDLKVIPGQNDITSGIMKITEYLAPVEGLGFEPDQELGALMYFSSKLTFVDDEFLNYFWKTSREGERIDEPRDGNDHAMDTIKYALSKLPDASELYYIKPKKTPEYMQWQEAP